MPETTQPAPTDLGFNPEASISFHDQVGLFDPSTFVLDVHVIGCGSIGQAIIQLLPKYGIKKIHVWDDDYASEPHNIPAQIISGLDHVGQYKVDVCADYVGPGWLNMPEEYEIITHRERVTAGTKLWGVVIVCVDSLAARAEIWKAVQNCIADVHFYVEGRIGGLQYEGFALIPAIYDLAQQYETFLVSDEYASGYDCGTRSSIHVAVQLATEMFERIRRFHNGLLIGLWFWKDIETGECHTS